MLMVMVMVMVVGQVHVEFHAGDRRFLAAGDMEMVAIEFELFQLAFQAARVHAEIEQGGNEHIAGNAADEVEIECFHFVSASALIWLAA